MREDLRVKKRKCKLGDVEEGFIQSTKSGSEEAHEGGLRCEKEEVECVPQRKYNNNIKK